MSNKDNEYTFKRLLEEYRVVIPIIQREYAQGRNTPRARKVRREFIRTIKEHLKRKDENGNNDFHLDFIFGVVKGDGKEVFTLENEKQKIMLIVERKEQERKRILIPIDGQQRLTLLFLLYYYLGVRAGKNVKSLKEFTYEVRDSSRDFIKKLVENTGWKDHIENIKCDEKDKQGCLSEWIKNQLWFLPGWEKDPTIQSMLTVLDEIHRQFKEEKDFKGLYEGLNRITFDFMDMKDYDLDEELYIKLNSTGRQLTEMEIFKAEFQKFLRELGNDKHEKFQNKIDNDWMDTFWKHFKYEQNGYYAVDATMLNSFYYMIEMLLFEMLEPPKSEGKKKKAEEESKNKLSDLREKFYGGDRWWDHISLWEIFEVVKNEDKEDKNKTFKKWLDTLFYALDNLENIHRLCDCIFHSGSLEEITPNDWKKVAIWTDNPNLLERVIFNYRYRFAPNNDSTADYNFQSIKTEDEKLESKIRAANENNKQIFNILNLSERILLYTLIKSVKHNTNHHEVLRITRNLIWSVYKSGISQNLIIQRQNIYYLLKHLHDNIFKFNNEQAKPTPHPYELPEIAADKKETDGNGENKITATDMNIPLYRYKHEQEKQKLLKQNPHLKCYIYALENHPYLKGDLRIFLHTGSNNGVEKFIENGIIENLKNYTKIFYEIFKQDENNVNTENDTKKSNDSKIIPLFISVALEKDRELNMFNYSNNREKKFFGYKNYWGYLLHSLSENRLKELQPIWIEFLKRIKERCGGNCEGENVKEALSLIKKEYKNVKDWRYYYITYEKFYEDFKEFGVPTEYNIFFVPREKEKLNWFFAEKLQKETAKGHHLNPFLYVICQKLKEEGLNCTTNSKNNDEIILHSGWDRREEHFYSHLELKSIKIKEIKIKTDWDEDKKEWVAKGWEIKIEGSEEIVNQLINIYHLEQQPEPKEDKKNIYILPMKDDKDLIGTLVDFITKVLNSEGIP